MYHKLYSTTYNTVVYSLWTMNLYLSSIVNLTYLRTWVFSLKYLSISLRLREDTQHVNLKDLSFFFSLFYIGDKIDT